MTISYEEFKKTELLVGLVKSIARESATIDFGSNRIIECKTGKTRVSKGELVIAVLNEGKAKLLAVKAVNGTLATLTIEKEAAPGTKVE